ncbi:MAG: hypothetical protein OET44_12780 [Gammaproteobacteria bacterium]|nr:hypothetical protein [Gammaproteobacteria bacterium]
MNDKGKILIAIAVLGIIDAVVPGLPILALVLAYVVVNRPAWFTVLYEQIYNSPEVD